MSTNPSPAPENGAIRITPENIDDLVYVPTTGTEYEIAPGVIRRLKKRTYGVQREFDALIGTESPAQTDPEADDYPEKVRMQCMIICTDGDEFMTVSDWSSVSEEIDLDVVGRVCADFFSLRLMRPRPQ
jgi:phosphomannomutase